MTAENFDIMSALQGPYASVAAGDPLLGAEARVGIHDACGPNVVFLASRQQFKCCKCLKAQVLDHGEAKAFESFELKRDLNWSPEVKHGELPGCYETGGPCPELEIAFSNCKVSRL